ncbi:MAG TPA: amino acid ABC transporter permease [Oscillospiraceae bacterium]|nr:amino acid ABC transporter permease [Oscillospiraceae bacterium]HNW04390.1 amino acid ABC transporter permease [Oscillospiraceae bacterium]HPV99963.1 amino acid ABC transporter permease [Oscillospiraceae bacterium]
MDFYGVFLDIWPMLLEGLAMTLKVSAIALFIAFFLGLASCLMGMSKIFFLKWLSKAYVWVIRGTPFIVQLFIVKYGFPQLVKIWIPEFNIGITIAAIATLALNAGAYLSEIFRGGIQAVDVGQMEAARSLGLPKGHAMRKVILPQAIRICIPSLGNQFIITLKDSSLAQVIGLNELFYQGKIYVGYSFKSFETYILVGCVYLLVIAALSYLMNRIERRLDCGTKS